MTPNTPKKEWAEEIRKAVVSDGLMYHSHWYIPAEKAEDLLTSRDEALIAGLEGMKYQQPLLGTPERAENIMLAVNKTIDEAQALIRGSRET